MKLSRSTLPLLIVVVAAPNLLGSAWKLDTEVRTTCLQVLREGLHSEEFWPAMHAAEALTLAGQQAEVRDFLEPKLESETDDQKRCGLSRELVRAGDIAKSEIMMDILRGADPHGHVHAAESLYKVGWQGGSELLQAAFRHSPNVKQRLMAAGAMVKFEEGVLKADALALLRTTLREASNPDTVRIAAWILARVGETKDVPVLRVRLEDAKPGLDQAYLEHALAMLGDPEGKRALVRNLESDDPAVRTYAAVFAGESGIHEAAPLLIRQLEDKHLDARIRAAQALIVLAGSQPS